MWNLNNQEWMTRNREFWCSPGVQTWGLVHGGEMLFEGQYDAVRGDDGSEDQVLKWSGWVKEKHRNNNANNKHKF